MPLNSHEAPSDPATNYSAGLLLPNTQTATSYETARIVHPQLFTHYCCFHLDLPPLHCRCRCRRRRHHHHHHQTDKVYRPLLKCDNFLF